jgi:FkbM family methyltransferase
MKKYGNFWVPDIDAKGRRNHKKMQNLFGDKDGSIDPIVKAMADLLAARSEAYSSDQIAIDAGANVGSYTRVLLEYYSRVIAIEPMSDTFRCLERNLHDWGKLDRVNLYNSAVSDAWDYVKIKRGWGRLSMTARVTSGGEISAIPIDELKLKNVGFIKLDVEGFEHKALRGATTTINESKPVVFMEVKPEEEEQSDTPYIAHEYLLSLGYDLENNLGRNWVYYPKSE